MVSVSGFHALLPHKDRSRYTARIEEPPSAGIWESPGNNAGPGKPVCLDARFTFTTGHSSIWSGPSLVGERTEMHLPMHPLHTLPFPFPFCLYLCTPSSAFRPLPCCLHSKSLRLLIHFLLLDSTSLVTLWSRPEKEIWDNLEMGQCGVLFGYHICIFTKIFLKVEY